MIADHITEDVADERHRLAYRIRQERKARGWNNFDLARRAGVNPNTVHRAEHAKVNKLDTILRIIAALGLTLAEAARAPEQWQDAA